MKEELLPKEYKDMVFSMSEFQIKHFVVNSQHNPYRQFKQILLELEVRYTNAEQINLEVEKNRLERDLLFEKMENETSPAQKKLYEFDIKKNDITFENIQRNRTRILAEIENLHKIETEFRSQYDVNEMMLNQDKHEHDYWIKRLATQSALEILTVGRIGVGNLEALMQMGPENFRAALVETTKIANEVKGQVKYLDMVGDQEQLQSGQIKEIDFKQQQ
jgi:hypothetical protein